jgi:hypothetical protein
VHIKFILEEYAQIIGVRKTATCGKSAACSPTFAKIPEEDDLTQTPVQGLAARVEELDILTTTKKSSSTAAII